jgi:hypothetical protein
VGYETNKSYVDTANRRIKMTLGNLH